MSIFLETNHLFLRNPRGGVEDVAAMKAAGFGVIFCNIRDYPPNDWALVRERAEAAGVICGPWAHTMDANKNWSPQQLDHIISTAADWGGTPYIVNSESEINNSGDEITTYIAEECAGDDWAMSTLPDPMQTVDWRPIADWPIMPQLFGPEFDHDRVLKWYEYGAKCVVPTYGSYNQWSPDIYERLTPYGVYTADDCANSYAPWGPTGVWQPCIEGPIPEPPPTNGDDMQRIGSQHGVTASMNRLRDIDPGGTLLRKAGNKWPSITTLTQPVSEWKAYDKLERSLSILVSDHDEMLDKQAT